MRNIAIVSNTSWYIYNFKKGLIRRMLQQGYNVTVIAPRDRFVQEIEQMGCTFVELTKIRNKGKNPFQDILLSLELKKLFEKNNIQCSLFFTPKINIFGSIAAKFSHTKAIATINGLGFVFNDGQASWLRFLVKKLYRYAFRNLFAVFFQNEEDKAFFIESKLVAADQPIFIVKGSGVNLDEFYQRDGYGQSASITFLLSARLLKEKGIYEYLEAAKNLKKKYPAAIFALLGVPADNPSRVPVEVIDKYHQQGIIDYWGRSDNMSEVLNKVDVMVLPSYYREGIPKVLLEGLAKGLAIITTDNVGCRETVENLKNGFLIPVKDTSALQEAMEKMISLPLEQRIEMSNYSRRKAESEFDEVSNHSEYLRLIEKSA